MRFFTRDWCEGSYDDGRTAAAVDEYLAHIERLGPRLPPPLLELAQDLRLHDCAVERIEIDADAGVCELHLRGEDGAARVRLRYTNATVRTSELGDVAEGTMVLSDELDVAGSHVEHRLLLAPDGELTIDFDHVSVIRGGPSV